MPLSVMHVASSSLAAALLQVRGAKYAKLKHEKNKAKKKERAKRAAEVARAEELGLEPPPKPVPKASRRLSLCSPPRLCIRMGIAGRRCLGLQVACGRTKMLPRGFKAGAAASSPWLCPTPGHSLLTASHTRPLPADDREHAGEG